MTTLEDALAQLVEHAQEIAELHDPLEVLRMMAYFPVSVNDVLEAAADSARFRGDSWTEIGQAVGTSKQAAWERYGKPRDLTAPKVARN